MSQEQAKTPDNDADILEEKLYQNIGEEKISLARNMSLGGAGLSLLGVIEIAMAGNTTPALMVSLYAFIVAIPLFVVIAMWHEVFIWLGEESHALFAELRKQSIARWSSLPLLALFVGICGIAMHLSIGLFILFLVLSIAAYVYLERSIHTVLQAMNKVRS